jgi:hypothetical protein
MIRRSTAPALKTKPLRMPPDPGVDFFAGRPAAIFIGAVGQFRMGESRMKKAQKTVRGTHQS